MTAENNSHTCTFCKRTFRKESTLLVHLCEPKRRYQERDDVGTQIGLQAYLRFYEVTQGSARLKNFESFADSSYYRAFVKFGRYCQSIKAIAVPRLIDYLVHKNIKLDHWTRDSVYTEFLQQYIKLEHYQDAIARALTIAEDWQSETQTPAKDYLRYGNRNKLCYQVNSGKLSPWVIYNCEGGQQFLSELNQEQVQMIWSMIDTDVWQKKFIDYASDCEYVKQKLQSLGW